MSLEELCKSLGYQDGNLNDKVKLLVEQKRLNEHVQQMLGIVRVFGNDAIHNGGELLTGDQAEDAEDAAILLETVNDIAEVLITKPRTIAEQFARFPETKRARLIKAFDIEQ